MNDVVDEVRYIRNINLNKIDTQLNVCCHYTDSFFKQEFYKSTFFLYFLKAIPIKGNDSKVRDIESDPRECFKN